MIGTIIIAVIGYGLALFFVVAGVIGLRAFADARAGSVTETVYGRATIFAFVIAIVFAAATRWLAGV